MSENLKNYRFNIIDGIIFPCAFLGATSGIIIVLDFINKGVNFYVQQICTCH